MRRQMRRAVTLVELMVVVAILVFLAAIVFPVGVRSIHRAKVTSSLSKCRQMHLATMIYRTDHDGDGRYGDIGTMGLPPPAFVLLNRFGLPEAMMQSACGNHPSEERSVLNIIYKPVYSRLFADEAMVFRENVVLYFDMNCSDASTTIRNPFESKLGIGVLLSGQATVRRKPGDYRLASWWADPSP